MKVFNRKTVGLTDKNKRLLKMSRNTGLGVAAVSAPIAAFMARGAEYIAQHNETAEILGDSMMNQTPVVALAVVAGATTIGALTIAAQSIIKLAMNKNNTQPQPEKPKRDIIHI